MSTRNSDCSVKPPHKKLQNDVAGIDEAFGSIYVIPAANDFVDDEEGEISAADGRRVRSPSPAVNLPHQLVSFGPNHEKVLIIPDYRVHHVVPGVAVKPLISSDKMIKIEDAKKRKEEEEAKALLEKQKNASSSASTADNTSAITSNTSSQGSSTRLAQRGDLVNLLATEFKESLGTVAPLSPITILAQFNGPEGVILLDMLEGMGVTNLEHLASFPASNGEGVNLLIEADMFINVVDYCHSVAALLQLSPPIGPNDFLKNKESANGSASSVESNEKKSASSDVSSSPGNPSNIANATSNTQNSAQNLASGASKRLPEVPGIDAQTCSVLYRCALVNTALDLANLAVRFPGIYGMLKLTNQIPNLDELIASASQMCGMTSASSSTSSGAGAKTGSEKPDLCASTHLNHLGEAQSPNVALKDISSKALVGVLDGMSVELANVLAVQIPPVTSLSALATFADVSPSEYTYLLRQYPQLADLSQQAALLVSIASGRAKSS